MASGRGGALALVGPAGVGESALLDLAQAAARRPGLPARVRGTAAAVGAMALTPIWKPWVTSAAPTQPCWTDWTTDAAPRSSELSGRRELHWTGESAHQRLFVAAAELIRIAAAEHGALPRRRRRARGRRRSCASSTTCPVAPGRTSPRCRRTSATSRRQHPRHARQPGGTDSGRRSRCRRSPTAPCADCSRTAPRRTPGGGRHDRERRLGIRSRRSSSPAGRVDIRTPSCSRRTAAR